MNLGPARGGKPASTSSGHVFCIAGAMLANVGVWDASCLPPREPTAEAKFLCTVVSNFCQFFAFVEFVGKPDPDDDQKPKPKPWKSLMVGLPFQIVAFDDKEFKYVTPYMTISDIVGLWGRTPTRESVLANHVDLARYRNTFPTWTKKLRKAMRKAAGVRPPNDPRLA